MNIPSYVSGNMYVQSYRILRSAVASCLHKYELSTTGWALLGLTLQARDGIRLHDAAAKLGVKAPLVTNLVHGLLEAGLMQRVPHPVDKRAKLLLITPKGRKFIEKVEAEITGALNSLLEGVSEEELVSYKKVLDTIIENGNKNTEV